jgi:hypothetical protein
MASARRVELHVPLVYRCCLQLLRDADLSGSWPRSSSKRKELIDGPRGMGVCAYACILGDTLPCVCV